MHCDLLKIYYALPILGITRMWICRLNYAQRPFFQAWGSLTTLKSQTRDPQFKVPPGALVLRIFTSWKNPSISPANLGSRGDHVTPRPPRPTQYEFDNSCFHEALQEAWKPQNQNSKLEFLPDYYTLEIYVLKMPIEANANLNNLINALVRN